jgi:hypothetical protein
MLRGAETTLNRVGDFRVYRPKEGGPEDDLQWRPMRKGVADLQRRAVVSAQANERLLDALAEASDYGRTSCSTKMYKLQNADLRTILTV